ncbi:WxL protein peptidoglycan domain-containing protein [Spirillospora sp. NPDC127200]
MNATVRTAAAALAALLAVAAAPPVLADPAPSTPAAGAAAPGKGGFTWAVRPSGPTGPSGRDYFVYTASPGQRIKDRVTITNLGDKPLTLRVYATDAFNTADGAFALLTADRQATGVGTWAAFDAGTQTVKPGERVQVPFTLTVPANATPGDHSGGIVTAVTEQRTSTGGQRVNVDRRVAARVHVRVNGPLTPSAQVDSLTADYSAPAAGAGSMKVTYRVRNTGNVRVTASARITTAGPFGWTRGKAVSRPIPELLPGNSYTFTERVAGVVPAGPLTSSVRLSLADPATGGALPSRPVVRTASAWGVPWLGLAALVLAMAGAVVLVRRHRRPA